MTHIRIASLLAALTLAAGTASAGPVADLLPDLTSTNLASLNAGQTALNKLCAEAGAPGSTSRLAVAREMAGLLAEAPPAAVFPLVHQLGLIGGEEAVPALVALLKSDDANLADAARMALERIPAAPAAQALLAGLAGARDDRARAGFVQSLGQRRIPEAVKAIAPFLKSDHTPLRLAAQRALAHLADGPAVQALGAVRTAAAAERKGELTTALFDAALSAQRQNQPAAAIAIFKQVGASAESEQVRAQALLGLLLADAKGAPAGVKQALASPSPVNQSAAITAVERLRGPKLAELLAAEIGRLAPPLQVQAAAALAAADEPGLAGALLPLLQSPDEPVFRTAVNALAVLGDGPAVAPLLALAAGKTLNKEAAAALADMNGAGVDAQLLSALDQGAAAQRAAALDALIARQNPELPKRLVKLAGDSDEKLALSALGALKRVATANDADTLLTLAREAKSRALAEAAVGVIFSVAAKQPDPAPLITRLGRALAGAPADTRRALLAAGSKFGQSAPVPAAAAVLGMMEPLLDDAELRANAAHFSVDLAARLLAADPELAGRVLGKVAALEVPAEIKTRAAAVTGLDDGWLLTGLIAGPYEGGDLFKRDYAPEKKGEKVDWLVLADTDRADRNNRIIDLAKRFSGDNRVAYLSFAFQWPAGGKAVLETGSDDGLVVWVNGQQVLANDATRGCQPGSDKTDVTLQPGMNRLLVKAIQRNGPFEFVGRVVNPPPPAPAAPASPGN